MPRPQSQSEATATGYWLALKTLRDDHSEFTIARCRRLWTEQRDATENDLVRWGLEGMLNALDAIEHEAPTIHRTTPRA